MVVCYAFSKVIPFSGNEKLSFSKIILLILVTSLTAFTLLFYSVDLPENVKMDLRHILIVIVVYYLGYKVAIPSLFVILLLRLAWGINPATIANTLILLIFVFSLPALNKFLKKRFNSYIVLLALSGFCVLISSVAWVYLFSSKLYVVLMFLSMLFISWFSVTVINLFITDIERSERSFSQEQERARTDFLTGLYNGRKFSECWKEVTGTLRGTNVSLLLIDIDYFKKINDSFGHESGNDVLQQLAAILRKHSPDYYQVYRIGGEEFCLLLEGLSPDEQYELAENIRNDVKNHKFKIEANETLKLTVSVGIASSDDPEKFPHLFRQADSALYQAKKLGRDRVSISNS